MSADEEIIVYAVRYALGRMSYAVYDVCRYVEYKKDSLSDYCKEVIIRDIEGGIEMWHRAGRTCGMKYDEESWLRLVKILKGE